MKPAVLAVGLAALAWIGRRRLVDALTRTTGTWVGNPPSPTSGR